MLKFKTSCAVLGYLSSNLLNEVGLSLFRYFEVGLYIRVCDIVVKKFTSAISSPDEFLYEIGIAALLFRVKPRHVEKVRKFRFADVGKSELGKNKKKHAQNIRSTVYRTGDLKNPTSLV